MASAITHPSALLHLSVHPADPALPGPRPAVLVLPGGGHREDTGHDGGEHGLAVDPGRIRVLGSSAGGHLAVLLLAGTVLSVEDPLPRPLRPDSAVLDHALDDLALLPGTAEHARLSAGAGAGRRRGAGRAARPPRGGHGVSLADGVRYGDHGGTRIPHTAHWTGDCERCMRAGGLL